MELTHAGPKDDAREAELSAPSGVVCSDFVRHSHLFLGMSIMSSSTISFDDEFVCGAFRRTHRSYA